MVRNIIVETMKMINKNTLEKLAEMNPTVMFDTFRHQLSEPRMKDVTFEDRFSVMIVIESSRQKNKRLDRLLIIPTSISKMPTSWILNTNPVERTTTSSL